MLSTYKNKVDSKEVTPPKRAVFLISDLIRDTKFAIRDTFTIQEQKKAEKLWLKVLDKLEKEYPDLINKWSDLPTGLEIYYNYFSYFLNKKEKGLKLNKALKGGVKTPLKIKNLLQYRQLDAFVINSYKIGEYLFNFILKSDIH